MTREEFIKQLPHGARCMEMGVFDGKLSEVILRETQPKHLVLFDCWLHASDQMHPIGIGATQDQETMDLVYLHVCHKFAPHPEVTPVRAISPMGADMFADGYFDWIYIDGHHSYPAVYADLCAWWPKVRAGGLICGHDYVDYPGREDLRAKSAVDDFLGKRGGWVELVSDEEYPDWQARVL